MSIEQMKDLYTKIYKLGYSIVQSTKKYKRLKEDIEYKREIIKLLNKNYENNI